MADVASLPSTGSVGDVYHVVDTDSEYIWVQDDSPSVTGHWEEFGSKLVIDHTHSIPQLTVSGTIPSVNVSGTATGALTKTKQQDIKMSISDVGLTTTNQSIVPSYNASTGNLVTAQIRSAGEDVVASKVSFNSSNLSTTQIKGVSGTTTVVNAVTAPTTTLTPISITGVSGNTTASKATAGTNVALAKRNSSQTIVGNANVGTATTVATGLTGGSQASWSANVVNGVLSFSFTPNQLQSANTTSITPAAASTTKIYGVQSTNYTLTPYTFSDVTVPKAATAQSVASLAADLGVVTSVSSNTTTVATANENTTTVATGGVASNGAGTSIVTSITSNNVTAAGPSTLKTVATGTISETGTGSTVMTGINGATAIKAITGVSVDSQPQLVASTSGVKTGEAITFGTSGTLTVTGTTNQTTLSNGKTGTGTTGNPK